MPDRTDSNHNILYFYFLFFFISRRSLFLSPLFSSVPLSFASLLCPFLFLKRTPAGPRGSKRGGEHTDGSFKEFHVHLEGGRSRGITGLAAWNQTTTTTTDALFFFPSPKDIGQLPIGQTQNVLDRPIVQYNTKIASLFCSLVFFHIFISKRNCALIQEKVDNSFFLL